MRLKYKHVALYRAQTQTQTRTHPHKNISLAEAVVIMLPPHKMGTWSKTRMKSSIRKKIQRQQKVQCSWGFLACFCFYTIVLLKSLSLSNRFVMCVPMIFLLVQDFFLKKMCCVDPNQYLLEFDEEKKSYTSKTRNVPRFAISNRYVSVCVRNRIAYMCEREQTFWWLANGKNIDFTPKLSEKR